MNSFLFTLSVIADSAALYAAATVRQPTGHAAKLPKETVIKRILFLLFTLFAASTASAERMIDISLDLSSYSGGVPGVPGPEIATLNFVTTASLSGIPQNGPSGAEQFLIRVTILGQEYVVVPAGVTIDLEVLFAANETDHHDFASIGGQFTQIPPIESILGAGNPNFGQLITGGTILRSELADQVGFGIQNDPAFAGAFNQWTINAQLTNPALLDVLGGEFDAVVEFAISGRGAFRVLSTPEPSSLLMLAFSPLLLRKRLGSSAPARD